MSDFAARMHYAQLARDQERKAKADEYARSKQGEPEVGFPGLRGDGPPSRQEWDVVNAAGQFECPSQDCRAAAEDIAAMHIENGYGERFVVPAGLDLEARKAAVAQIKAGAA